MVVVDWDDLLIMIRNCFDFGFENSDFIFPVYDYPGVPPIVQVQANPDSIAFKGTLTFPINAVYTETTLDAIDFWYDTMTIVVPGDMTQ